MNKKLLVLIVAIALIVLMINNVAVFEDGSWAVGSFPYPLSGCFPWGLCN